MNYTKHISTLSRIWHPPGVVRFPHRSAKCSPRLCSCRQTTKHMHVFPGSPGNRLSMRSIVKTRPRAYDAQPDRQGGHCVIAEQRRDSLVSIKTLILESILGPCPVRQQGSLERKKTPRESRHYTRRRKMAIEPRSSL